MPIPVVMRFRPAMLALALLAITSGQPASAAGAAASPKASAPGTSPSANPGAGKPVAAVAPAVVERDQTVQLGAVEVRPAHDDEEFDPSGLGSYEQQLRDWPFANELVTSEPVEDPVVNVQLAQIANPSAVDLATGESRVSLRGFPAPLLRNGFVSMGATDMLNTSRMVVIQGALVPVLGRAAPGGIQDFWTARPGTRPSRRFDYSMTSQHTQSAGAEIVGITRPKLAWHRVALNWSRRTGPDEFSANEIRTVSGAVAWRHSPTLSSLWALDWQEQRANLSPGIPEYRVASGARIIGPYLPLAGFNVFGPDAGIRRRTGSANVWFDAQPHPRLLVRGGLEWWWRNVKQDRFTTGLYNIAARRFEGTREPRHTEQPQNVVLVHLEMTRRFAIRRTEHKLMGAVSQTWGSYTRGEWALPTAVRDKLPLDARLFSPGAPNYSRTPYSRAVYSRILTDRQERVRYTALELTERMGLANGRWVFATGLRKDIVGLNLTDRRPGNTLPRVSDEVGELTYHLGANYQLIPGRVLLFATTSTAFDPSTRVDARTGRIQGNDTTRGYEGGVKSRSKTGVVEVSASGFLLFNQDISRRNPLYDDPIFDANQTQPQLVAAGEERFSGGKIEGRWRPPGPWSFSGRAGYTRAMTTKSPDLPQEVGRELTRFPPYTASASAGYSVLTGRLKGLSLSGGWSYVSSYVAQYEDKQRYKLSYPGYGLVSVNANWLYRRKTYAHGFGFGIRNLLDYNLARYQARLGGGREFVGSYRLSY